MLAALSVLCFCVPLQAQAAADISVEQVQCVMPEIKVYLRAENGLKAGSVQALLDGEALPAPEITPFAESGAAMHYYVVLDNSGSVPKQYVQPLREAVTHFGETLRNQDTMRVYTVGETVEMLYDGGGGDQVLAEALEQYTAKEQETVLFEALVQCAEAARRQTDTEPERSAVLVFSDGMNESVGVSVYDEAVQHLQEAQLPVYAFGLGNDAESLDAFGKLARDTGGQLRIIKPAEADEALQESVQQLGEEFYILSMQAPTNEVGGNRELLLKCTDYSFSQTLTLRPEHWQPDHTPPEVLSVEQEANDRLRITFSENVQGAEELSHYILSYAGSDTPIPLYHVRYKQENGQYYALLETEREPVRGDYTLSMTQITDVSQEKNPLKNADFACTLEGRSLVEGNQSDFTGKIILILVLAALCCLLPVLLLHKKKQPAAEADMPQGEPAADPKQIHVMNPEGVPRSLHLTVRTANAAPVQMEAVIENTLTFGRSSHCQVYFDDPSMSRRHFELTVSGTELRLADCGSTGGTTVNGVPVSAPVTLSQGDRITAGVTEITIRW